MDWNTIYQGPERPTLRTLSGYVAHPLWDALTDYLDTAYRLSPSFEYSRCSMGMGWNVKYKAGGAALCTLYPAAGAFVCLVVVGGRLAAEAQLLLPVLSPGTQALWAQSAPMSNGTRWLSLEVDTPRVLEDVKALLALKRRPKTAHRP